MIGRGVHGSNFFGSATEVKQHCRDIGHADVTQQSSLTTDAGAALTSKRSYVPSAPRGPE